MSNPTDRTAKFGLLKPTLPALAAFAMLATYRIVLVFLPEFHLAEVDTTRLHGYYRNELRFRAAPELAPQVVVFGTSRLLRLQAGPQANLLRVPGNDILNLSSPGNYYWQIYLYLRRNPEVVKNAKVVLIDVLPFQVFESGNDAENDTLFLRYSTLEERLRVKDPLQRLGALADLVLPLRSERMTVFNWRRAIRDRAMTEQEELERHNKARIMDYRDMLGFQDQLRDLDLAGRKEIMLKMLFPSPDIVPGQVESLYGIRELVPAECKIVLAWLPLEHDTHLMIQESDEWSRSVGGFRQFLDTVDMPNTYKPWYFQPSDLGLESKDYTGDGVHFLDIRKLSQVVAAIEYSALGTTP